MARKKVTLAYISNDVERKASFRKRKKGLLKKAEELTTLCDIQACVIIYSPYDMEPEVWPSRAEAMEVLARYRNLSEIDKSKKMVNQESFTRQRLKKVEEQLRRLRRENKRREMESFMYRCISGMVSLQRFDLSNAGEMRWVVDQTLRDISSRMDALKINGPVGSSPGAAEAAVVTGWSSSGAAEAAAVMGRGNMDGYLLDHICGSSGVGGELGWALGSPSNPYSYGSGARPG